MSLTIKTPQTAPYPSSLQDNHWTSGSKAAHVRVSVMNSILAICTASHLLLQVATRSDSSHVAVSQRGKSPPSCLRTTVTGHGHQPLCARAAGPGICMLMRSVQMHPTEFSSSKQVLAPGRSSKKYVASGFAAITSKCSPSRCLSVQGCYQDSLDIHNMRSGSNPARNSATRYGLNLACS